MEKIKFLKDKTIYDGYFSSTAVGDYKRVTIKFKDNVPENDVLLSGFNLLNEHNFAPQYDGTMFTYLYLENEDGSITLTDSVDDVYVEPKPIPEPEPTPEPEPYVPTEEELAAMLEINKQNKITESKQALELFLSTNPLISTCHGGVEGVYTITSEKQSLMANNYIAYTLAKSYDETAVLTWNETGKECELWTEEEFIQLILESMNYVKPLVAQQQKYEVEINACTTQEELDAIVIMYSI